MNVSFRPCSDEHNVANLDIGNHGSVLLLDLGEGASPAIRCDLAPQQAAEAVALHELSPAVEYLSARALDCALDHHGLDDSAALDGPGDDAELGA